MEGAISIEPKAIRYKTKEDMVDAFLEAGYKIFSKSHPGVEYWRELRKKVIIPERLRVGDYASVKIYTLVPEELDVCMEFPTMAREECEGEKHECHISYKIRKEGLVPKNRQAWNVVK